MTLDFTRIGQIGLGYMGSALAKRLQDLGKIAIGHDIDAAKMAALAEAGVACRDSAAAVTREVDVVVVCVTSTDCVERAVFGPGGVAEAGAAGKVVVDISTTVADNGPVVRDAIAIFGVARCMFASNFPVDGLVADYRTIYSGFREITADLPPDDLDKLYHDNAVGFYRLNQEKSETEA